MEFSYADVRLARLLEHAGWIRALARELVRDPDLADEIEQRTWLAALEHDPRPGVPQRSWLGTIVRNLVREARRAGGRRAAHEAQAARSEGTPSTSDIVERAGLQRELLEAVLGLDEPYRTTILLRFYEGLAPREIAARMQVPVETVRTRTGRALTKLRERLDQRHGGDRTAWLSGLVPLVHASPISVGPIGTPWPGALLLMNTKLKVTLAVLLLAGVAAFVLLRSDDGARTLGAEKTADRERLAPSPAAADTLAGDTHPGPESERAQLGSASAPRAPENAAAPRLLHGKVIDDAGHALSGVHVGFDDQGEHTPARAPAVSAADGSFALGRVAGAGRLVDYEEAWTTVLAGAAALDSGSSEPVLVLARPRALAGTVVDELGLPLAGSVVRVELEDSFRTRFREVLDFSTEVGAQARCDAQGAFDLGELPLVPEAQVSVQHDGYLPWSARLSDLAARTVITLIRPRAAEGVLRGKVVDSAGQVVPKACVAFGIDTTRCDEQGLFAFQIGDPKSQGARWNLAPDALVAVLRGMQPARFEPPLVAGQPVWPAFVTLQLGGPALEITGRVLGPDGEPLAGAHVWLMDARMLGEVDGRSQTIEGVLAGYEGRMWRRFETDPDGRFAIDGLTERDYHLEAMDPHNLLRVQEGPFAAGAQSVELRLPQGELHARVAGRVVSKRGQPVAGARVYAACDCFRTRVRGQIVGTMHGAAEAVTTGADGRFELKDVPKQLVYLRIDGEEILPLEFCRVGDGDDRFESEKVSRLPQEHIEELEIVVELRCHVQVALSDATSADEVELHDAQDRPLDLNIYDGNGRMTRDRFPLSDGRSAAFAVSDAARTVVLFKQGREVGRVPVELEPGALKEVRF